MIKKDDILYLGYLKQAAYTGSCQPLRYRLERRVQEGEERLLALAWPEPYNLANTPKERVLQADFPFGQEGLDGAIEWLRGQWEAHREDFAEYARHWERLEA